MRLPTMASSCRTLLAVSLLLCLASLSTAAASAARTVRGRVDPVPHGHGAEGGNPYSAPLPYPRGSSAPRTRSGVGAPCSLAIVGAGWGELLGAFVAINSSLYEPTEVCIFEKEGRVGGRALTLTGAFPTKNRPSLGAHRYAGHPVRARSTPSSLPPLSSLSAVLAHRGHPGG